jgi:hypothetical protein
MKTPNRIWIIDEWEPFSFQTIVEDGVYGIQGKHGIAVEKSLNNRNVVTTTAHEAMHGVLNKTGLATMLTDDIEEAVCRSAELLIASLLTDEEMMAWLMD